MIIGLPTAPDALEPSVTNSGSYTYKQGEAETFIFDLRSVEFKTESESTGDEQAESARLEKTGKLIGPNYGLPSLNEIYGNNSWAIKYGDNPVRETVFFREDIDLMDYIGEEITFSYIFSKDGHAIDAYIVE